jgi:hypothetical protein
MKNDVGLQRVESLHKSLQEAFLTTQVPKVKVAKERYFVAVKGGGNLCRFNGNLFDVKVTDIVKGSFDKKKGGEQSKGQRQPWNPFSPNLSPDFGEGIEQEIDAFGNGIEKEKPCQPEGKGRDGVDAVEGPAETQEDKGKDQNIDHHGIP